jgi:anti-sigma regulatory factor (Ser/Thr protein kinase)
LTAGAPLTFRDVDGLARQAANGALEASTLGGAAFRAEHLGPVAEMAALVAAKRLPVWVLADHVRAAGGGHLIRAVIDGALPVIARNGDRIGAFSLANANESAFISFNLAARKAAEAAGFSNNTAAQLGAALFELKNNIVDHSLATQTGVLFFCGGSRWFEFGATDRGQGVLASLRSWPDYADLANHGDALRLAVSEGGTRYGPGSQHGYGFRPIFLGLAGYRGYLRWRSGDHALVIDGRDADASSGDLLQKPLIDGLTLSVRCSLD